MQWTDAQTAPAKPAPTPQQREAVRQGASLTIVAILAIMIIGAFALVLLARYRRAAFERGGGDKKKRAAARTDAWHESAKRVRIADAGDGGGSDDDTVDIDPGDLSPDDVNDGDGPGGKGWKP